MFVYRLSFYSKSPCGHSGNYPNSQKYREPTESAPVHIPFSLDGCPPVYCRDDAEYGCKRIQEEQQLQPQFFFRD